MRSKTARSLCCGFSVCVCWFSGPGSGSPRATRSSRPPTGRGSRRARAAARARAGGRARDRRVGRPADGHRRSWERAVGRVGPVQEFPERHRGGNDCCVKRARDATSLPEPAPYRCNRFLTCNESFRRFWSGGTRSLRYLRPRWSRRHGPSWRGACEPAAQSAADPTSGRHGVPLTAARPSSRSSASRGRPHRPRPGRRRAADSGPGAIKGRSLAAIAWRRLRRDKLALAGGIVIVLFVLARGLRRTDRRHALRRRTTRSRNNTGPHSAARPARLDAARRVQRRERHALARRHAAVRAGHPRATCSTARGPR